MSVKLLFVLVAILGSLSLAEADKLPSYIKTCKATDPELRKCIVKRGREALPHVIKGDRKYKIPVLDPISIPEVKVEHGRPPVGLTVTFKDVVMSGLALADFKDSDTDLQKRSIKSFFWLPRIEVISKYEVDGRILVLPITGKGNCNVTMVGCKMDHLFEYDLVTKEDGQQYMNITRLDMKFEPKRVYYKFDNLFNGDKFLGDNMNTFLNENWMEVSDELNPSVIEVINKIVNGLAAGVTSAFPYNEIFPE